MNWHYLWRFQRKSKSSCTCTCAACYCVEVRRASHETISRKMNKHVGLLLAGNVNIGPAYIGSQSTPYSINGKFPLCFMDGAAWSICLQQYTEINKRPTDDPFTLSESPHDPEHDGPKILAVHPLVMAWLYPEFDVAHKLSQSLQSCLQLHGLYWD